MVLLQAAWDPFAGTLGARGGNAAWGASSFDSTLGFPGEAPPPSQNLHGPAGPPSGRQMVGSSLSGPTRTGGF